jgi:hypothetical protein
MDVVYFHENDKGTDVELEVLNPATKKIEDISDATAMTVKIKRPDGTLIQKDASFVTDGTDGLMQFTTIADDFSPAGRAKLQACIEAGTGKKHHTTVYDFTINEVLS